VAEQDKTIFKILRTVALRSFSGFKHQHKIFNDVAWMEREQNPGSDDEQQFPGSISYILAVSAQVFIMSY